MLGEKFEGLLLVNQFLAIIDIVYSPGTAWIQVAFTSSAISKTTARQLAIWRRCCNGSQATIQF